MMMKKSMKIINQKIFIGFQHDITIYYNEYLHTNIIIDSTKALSQVV